MPKTMFHQLEGETVILRANGTFKQVDVFEYEGCLFAGQGSSFIRLMAHSQTSKPKTFWENLSVHHRVGKYDRLVKG